LGLVHKLYQFLICTSRFFWYSLRMFGNKQKPKITRNKNITTIETGIGTYTILYGLHVVAQNPDDVPENTTGIILETGIHPWLKDPVKTIQKLKNHLQYKLLFERLEKEQVPVLFADVKYKYNNFALLLADNLFSAAGWIGGKRLINQLIRHDAKPQRGFVTHLAYGVAGAWLLLPVVSNMTCLVSAITGEGMEQSARLKKLSHKLHPEAELLYLSLRNAVIAEKAYYLAQTCGKKAHIAIVLGAGHVGIEDMLIKSHVERLGYLKKFQNLLHKIVLPEYLYAIIRMGYNGKEWRMEKTEKVPALEALSTVISSQTNPVVKKGNVRIGYIEQED
jgi:hypothetical protein